MIDFLLTSGDKVTDHSHLRTASANKTLSSPTTSQPPASSGKNGQSPASSELFDGIGIRAPLRSKATPPAQRRFGKKRRLTDAEKLAIRAAFEKLDAKTDIKKLAKQLARQYQVTERTIYRIKGAE